MAGKLKVAVYGVGFVGQQHIRALRQLPDVEIVALVVTTEAKAKRLSEELAIPSYYTSLEALISHHPDLDVIHNCSPTGIHYESTRRILEAGIHVYCEKPLTMTSEQSAELVTLIEEKKLLGGVNFNYRHNLMVMEMHERVKAGDIGPVWFSEATYLQDWLLDETDYDWRCHPELGGATRAISDIGSHCFDTLQYILDSRIISVESRNLQKYQTRYKGEDAQQVGNEDAAIIIAEFDNGVTSLIRVSQVTAGKKNDFRVLIEGFEQSLEWQQEQPDRLWVGHREEANQEVYADARYLSPTVAPYAELPNGHAVGWSDAFNLGIQEFYTALKGNTEANYVSFQEGHDIMRIIDACVQSQKTQTKIML